jgi:hypothetical protein
MVLLNVTESAHSPALIVNAFGVSSFQSALSDSVTR